MGEASALRACQQDTGTACTGLVAAGDSEVVRAEGGTYVTVKFGIYAFDGPGNATVAQKAVGASARQQATGEVKMMQVDAGADETESFADVPKSAVTGTVKQVVMRVGGAVVRVRSLELDSDAELTELAKLQVERVRKVAAGENPDA
ncbi:hypothetical protein AAHZ94_16705 [Streptomyces sp. HSW2009]|uniref:hypothetical protein n=1 Tax=Streptomyces sp. HSW2009 TaxID=3142890 RepID=UPI0032EBFCA3